jgi:hypothetical protein
MDRAELGKGETQAGSMKVFQEEELPSLRGGGRLSREGALKWEKSQWGPYLGLGTYNRIVLQRHFCYKELCYKERMVSVLILSEAQF